MRELLLLLLCAALAAPGCGDDGSEDAGVAGIEADPFSDFLGGGKEDTGYVGDRAVELEATLSSRVALDLSAMTVDERAAELARAVESPRAVFSAAVTRQVKHGRIQLRREAFQLNLERGDATYGTPEAVGDRIAVDFTIDVDTLVKLKDLADDIAPSTLIGKKTTLRLPLDPEAAFAAGGPACASQDDGSPAEAEDLEEVNYFYYFDPDREGCLLPDAGMLHEASFEVRSSLDAPESYPEYDLLTEDGQISMVAVFGQIKHGELERWDWGWLAYEDFGEALRALGFARAEQLGDDESFGEVLQRTYPGNLRVSVSLYNPVAVADGRDRGEVDALFEELIRSNELVYYNGHSFYGSLAVLKDREAYPEDIYQVVFMDSCWSYAYYTKQVFDAKATEEDPEGARLADVVNNTEPGITGSHETAFLLWRYLFEAASGYRTGGDVQAYSWLNLIRFMNKSADDRAARRTTHTSPEIYGVSGARDNAFRP